ncbi:hypothetical protein DL771_001082 [Monosporascus sp. 5C6A]|nr:hypothetical protein DL771_001082 [Monosporascus sp. 5C6A]
MAPTTFKLNNGMEMPALGLGTWQSAPGEVAAAVTAAIKHGYKLIDAAYCYGNEDEVGQGLKAAFDAGYAKREDIFVVTKLWNTYSTRVELGLDKSLKALGLDYVDQFLVHWPVGMNPNGNDDRFPKLPNGERDMLWDHDHVATWKDMEKLLQTGKTKSIGVCNYSLPYLKKLLEKADVVPAVNQIENHPALRQQEVVDFCNEKGIHVVAYSPLGSTGSPLFKAEPVVKVAERKGVSPGTVLLSYHVARGSTVLAKSVNEERIKSNMQIVDLDAEDMKILNDYSEGLEKEGKVQRFVYPPFGINFGFPDKLTVQSGMDVVGSSLGLAGSALKLVTFSIEFVSDVKQVYHLGATERNVDLATVAITEIGRKLATDLSKVTTDQKSKWKSLRAVARGMWDAEDIQTTEKRLRSIREEIQLRILIDIKKEVGTLRNEDPHRLRDAIERISSAQADCSLEIKQMIELLSGIERVTNARYKELLDLYRELLAGINASPLPRPPSPTPLKSGLDDPTAWNRVVDTILHSLWYPTIDDREESIGGAYGSTFDWLFHNPKAEGKPWDSFVDFLQGDTGAYWITGKPGSGKSTLTKFLSDDPRTIQHLNVWAAGRELLQASFYFYYKGSDMQKSEYGLVLSVLYNLLKQRPDLVPVAFEDRSRHLLLHEESVGKPSPQEARRALKRLFITQTETVFFLTIDGLDEFDPKVSATHVQSLLDLGRTFSELPNVKVVFASRPLNEFEEAFADCPSLKIHQLTHDDICLYVGERLEKHNRMQTLLARDPTNASKLVWSIVASSDGVFLWVRLVVGSLIDGLKNYDGIEDLQRRVDELPRDLYDLYDVMLSRVPNTYRLQTAKLLRLVYSIPGFKELSVLGLWYAEQATHEMVIRTAVSPITDPDLEYRYNEMEHRLKSRCLGLIEIQPSRCTQDDINDLKWGPRTDIYDFTNKFLNAQVKFLHRSVFEFLKGYDWDAFINGSGDNFEPFLSLLRSAVLMLKSYRTGGISDWPILLKMASYAGRTAREVREDSSPGIAIIDSTMSEHLMKLRVLSKGNKMVLKGFESDPGIDSHWSAWYDTFENHRSGAIKVKDGQYATFTSFAVDHHLYHQTRNENSTIPSALADPKKRNPNPTPPISTEASEDIETKAIWDQISEASSQDVANTRHSTEVKRQGHKNFDSDCLIAAPNRKGKSQTQWLKWLHRISRSNKEKGL